MDEKEFLEGLEKNVLTGETFTMDTDLLDFDRWDSVAAVAFMAWLDVDYGLKLNPLEVNMVTSVRELYELAQEAGE